MIKKITISLAIILALIVTLLISVPYFFKEKIKATVLETLNEKVDAKINFADADINLFTNFPSANVKIEKLVICNKAPFAGDTLLSLDELNLKMALTALFKEKNEPLKIDGIHSKNGFINLIINKDGIANYDIAIKKEASTESSKSNPLSLKIQNYQIENFQFRYFDQKSKMKIVMDSLNHEGTGDFNAEKLDLDTKSSAKIVFSMDKINYMKNVSIKLDAVLGLDLKNKKYVFKKNTALVNQLPITLDGSIQLLENGQQFDLKFQTPTSSFKNFLALIPEAYSGSLANVKTNGDFNISGHAKGLYSASTVPKFSIKMASNNGSFQYSTLPKAVRNIVIDAAVTNETGLLNDTFFSLDQLSFAIDKDIFKAKAHIKNITQNAIVDAELKGTINLATISKAYPLQLGKPLSGILKADVTTHFDMQSVEKSQYEKIKNSGTMSLSGFQYSDENGKKMTINQALIQFNPSKVHLKQLIATTGKSDIKVSGILENFYGFMFRKQELKGNFSMISNLLMVSDFMTESSPSKTGTPSKAATAMKIPAFLNCSIDAKANTVLYDNLTLKDVSGKLIVQNEKASLQNVKTSIFGGTIGLNGTVSTQQKTPVFKMKLNLNQLNIAQTFTQLDMFKKIAPIAGIVNGKINSTLQLDGTLNPTELTPNLNTLSGDLLGQFLSTTVSPQNSTLLNAVGGSLKFIDISKINLNDIKTMLTFKNGKVAVKPFDIKYKDIKATIGGTHGFDQNMNYDLKLDVPAKYLGNQANALLSKLSPADVAKLENLPINALMTGNFSNPKIATDMKNALTSLTHQVAQQQKERLVKKGSTALNDFLNKNSTKTADSTKTATQKEDIKTKATELLNGLFTKKKKTETPKTP